MPQPYNALSQAFGYGRDTLQGASNALASGVSAPVDGISWLMRKAGLGGVIGSAPFGGSDWMAQHGLTREPQNALAGGAGEILGSVVPGVLTAKAPQLANALLRMAENSAIRPTLSKQAGALYVGERQGATAAEMAAAQRNAAMPATEGGLGLPAGNSAAERMAAMQMEPGWFRGGSAPVNGAPTGPWYTQIKDEAADYAARTPAATRDVREYALSNAGRLKFDGGYPSRLATDLATLLEKDGHAAAAKTLRGYYADGSPVSGMAVYKFLQRNVGDSAPVEYLQRLGFRSVDGVNSPNYRQMLNDTGVRDAKRAAFDPKRRAERNIFAASAGALPLAGVLLQDEIDPGNWR